MTDEERDAAGHDDAAHETEQRRRSLERARRRARVFGDVLPEATTDDLPGGSTGSERSDGGTGADEEWLRANVPPHHGSSG